MVQPGFKHGSQLTEAIRHVVSRAPADIAVAYWGTNACDQLHLPSDLTGYRIACDAYSGFCSPVALGEMLRRNARIVDVPALHAKVYRSKAGFVSASANASSRGLSEDPHAPFGLEAGLFETSEASMVPAVEWLDRVFATGRTIGQGDLPEIKQLWQRARAGRPLGATLTQAIVANSALLADRHLRVYTYTAAEPDQEATASYQATDYFDPKRPESSTQPFFWGEMPSTVSVGDELLCFEYEDGKVSCEGIWRILDRIGRGTKTIWPAALVQVSFARGLGPTREICGLARDAIRESRLEVDGKPISLPEFAAIIGSDDAGGAHLSRIVSEEARSAYRLLLERSAALGVTVSYKSGKVPAVRWHDAQCRYLFSFIPNKHDLLFYVRKPALEAAPELAAQARALALEAKQNPKGEQTLRVQTPADARMIIDWLQTVLPLGRGDQTRLAERHSGS
jgi:hypothetical protein